MSSDAHTSATGGSERQPRPRAPRHYAERARNGDITWLEDCIADVLGIYVTDVQRQICRSVAANQKSLVVTANGNGKSYILAAITNAWLYALHPATVLATSGTEKKMKRTFCKPVEAMHKRGLGGMGLPGRYLSRPERIKFDDYPEHWFEATSPSDSGELEGVHSRYHLSIIEEADKDAVDDEVFDAMDSLVTDERDRIIAIANPPEDEVDIVSELLTKTGTWNVLQFSSFDSHNVQVELGEVEGEPIDGLATLWKIKEDWLEHNDEPWPGAAEAQRVSLPKLDEHGRPCHDGPRAVKSNPDYRDDLSKRWYRRRMGTIPAHRATANRPITASAVKAAWQRDTSNPNTYETPIPQGVGIDVARANDRTVVAALYGDVHRVEYSEVGTDHTVQEPRIRAILDQWPHVPIVIDAVGEGSGMADRLCAAYPNASRFKAGSNATDEETYKDCWSEGLGDLGDWLDLGIIDSTLTREEMLACARAVEYDEVFVGSRGPEGDEVYKATKKDAIKDVLERSPDHLDASMMAAWAAAGKARRGPDGLTW